MESHPEYPEIQHLQSFLQAHARVESRVTTIHIREETAVLRSFLIGFRSLDKALEPLRKLEAPRYNLFEILNIRHLEAKVHTPFLGNLLRPWGSHHQGDLFLRAFFNKVADRPGWLDGLTKLRIMEEKGTGDGFADIVIRGSNPDGEFGIVVENKIYAGDQKKQLERYQHYLSETLGLPEERCLLIYLAPRRKRPSIPYSILQVDFDSLHNAKRLLLRSYKKDIRDWLTPLLPLVQAPKVRFTLQQYLEIINRI